MHLKPTRLLYVLPLLLPLACKDAETVSVQSRDKTAQAKLEQGRELLSSGQAELAAKVLGEAVALQPDSTETRFLLADAQRQAGNSGAAIMTLKEAMALHPAEAPVIKRKLAERYEQDGRLPEAISLLRELRDSEELGDVDILKLAHLQALEGQHQEAFQTLERIQRERPDDVDAKVVEAEILLAKGEEILATKLMDRLLMERPPEEPPPPVAARVLRARYFLRNGLAEYAELDLSQVQGEEASRPEVVALRAQVLIALERLGEAEKLLADAVTRYPENADLLARLAEVKLLQGHPTETLALVERALRARPESARALYVRAHTLETQGELERAREDYDSALALSPRLAPALSRMWRLQRQAGEREKAMSSLERLVEVGEASLEEKVALAELYAELRLKPEQGLKLIGEALKREPDNFQYQDTQKALKKLVPRKKKSSGPLIIRGGRR